MNVFPYIIYMNSFRLTQVYVYANHHRDIVKLLDINPRCSYLLMLSRCEALLFTLSYSFLTIRFSCLTRVFITRVRPSCFRLAISYGTLLWCICLDIILALLWFIFLSAWLWCIYIRFHVYSVVEYHLYCIHIVLY